MEQEAKGILNGDQVAGVPRAADRAKNVVAQYPETFYNSAEVALLRGDCRDLLPRMRVWEGCFDAVVTDPPYGIVKGAAFVKDGGQRVDDDYEETYNALVADVEWMPHAAALLRDGGYFATFCDTRRVRETEETLVEVCGLNLWRRFYLINQAPPPTPRPTFMSGVQECVIAWKGDKREWYGGGSTPNFWIGLPATRNELSTHPAEKPLQAIMQLLRALTAPGAYVLDPFAGSGTTLRACQMMGRNAVGIELEDGWCREIVNRLRTSRRTADEQPVLF